MFKHVKPSPHSSPHNSSDSSTNVSSENESDYSCKEKLPIIMMGRSMTSLIPTKQEFYSISTDTRSEITLSDNCSSRAVIVHHPYVKRAVRVSTSVVNPKNPKKPPFTQKDDSKSHVDITSCCTTIKRFYKKIRF